MLDHLTPTDYWLIGVATLAYLSSKIEDRQLRFRVFAFSQFVSMAAWLIAVVLEQLN
jgi:hypothetical protein